MVTCICVLWHKKHGEEARTKKKKENKQKQQNRRKEGLNEMGGLKMNAGQTLAIVEKNDNVIRCEKHDFCPMDP